VQQRGIHCADISTNAKLVREVVACLSVAGSFTRTAAVNCYITGLHKI